MILKWHGEGYTYAAVRYFVLFEAHGVDLLFVAYKQRDLKDEEEFKNHYFYVDRASNKFMKTITPTWEIEEEVESVYLIKTDDDFRKRLHHSYYIMKFVTENEVLTIGAYTDTKNKPTEDNSYLLCTTDFINLLAPSQKVETGKELKDTSFEKMMCLFDKKELAKELLR